MRLNSMSVSDSDFGLRSPWRSRPDLVQGAPRMWLFRKMRIYPDPTGDALRTTDLTSMSYCSEYSCCLIDCRGLTPCHVRWRPISRWRPPRWAGPITPRWVRRWGQTGSFGIAQIEPEWIPDSDCRVEGLSSRSSGHFAGRVLGLSCCGGRSSGWRSRLWQRCRGKHDRRNVRRAVFLLASAGRQRWHGDHPAFFAAPRRHADW